MLRFHFSLASKQVLLSIALIVFTLLPLGLFMYEESVENIQQAYFQSIQSSLENVETRIIQDWRERNVIRSLQMEKAKKILLNMSVFTAHYVDYLLNSGLSLSNVQRDDENNLTLAKNMQFYIFDEKGDLYVQNISHKSRTLHSLGDLIDFALTDNDILEQGVFENKNSTAQNSTAQNSTGQNSYNHSPARESFNIENFNTMLAAADNNLFYVFQANAQETQSVLAHVQKLPEHGFYLVTTYNLTYYDLEVINSPEFLYEVLETNFDYKELLEGGFFLAYDTYHNRLITQSATDIELPQEIIENAIQSNTLEPYSKETFFADGEEYYCIINYLRKEYILIITVFNKKQVAKSTNESMQSLLYLIVVILAIGSLLAFYFGKTLMRPLARLRNMAEKIPQLDFNAKPEIMEDLPLNRRDEIGDLARTFSTIQDLLYKNVANLVEIQSKNERINAELNAARAMQMGLLPTNFPKFSYTNPYNLNALCIPAREVGGDLYDFFMVDEDHLCFYIGDVSGKGMSAAFFMSIASTLIQVNMRAHKNVKIATEILNEQLCRRNPESLFITLFLALYNIKTGELKYSSAGHLPALLLDKHRNTYVRLENPNFILGLMTDIDYFEHSLQLDHNQMLYLYTDGITEALDEKRPQEDKFYGEMRLEESLSRLSQKLFQGASPNNSQGNSQPICPSISQGTDTNEAELLATILNKNIKELYAFCDGTQQADDITCLALYRP